jgi:hypothetical protein
MASTIQHQFTIIAYGHVNIRATHSSTFEITMDSQLSLKGDCIIGIKASHSAQHLNQQFGEAIRHPQTKIITHLTAGTITDQIHGVGSARLILNSPTSLVWRTSDYVDNRTLAIRCNKAAKDLNRRLIESLQNPETELQVTITFTVELNEDRTQSDLHGVQQDE